MGVVTGLVTFIIIWWTVLFMVLPLRVRSQSEAGAVAEGSEPGAPEHPRLWWKVALTTGVAAGIWAVVFVLLALDVVRLSDLPLGPLSESPRD